MNRSAGIAVVGAGPAGLTAAHELVRRGQDCLVLEQGDRVGGIARTEEHRGYRFDIGGHRFYTKVDEVERLWQEMMGPDFIKVPRLSRIYYNGRFFKYPLEIGDALANLGVTESARIMASFVRSRLKSRRDEETFEQWVTNRFGRRLFDTFFKTYTEKVWGMPCDEIGADWAAQRIKGLSLTSAVANAVGRKRGITSLIEEFHYPILGPGMMWERFAERVSSAGSDVMLETSVEGIRHDSRRVRSIRVRRGLDAYDVTVDHLLTTMPLAELIEALEPGAPDHVRRAARALSYRSFLIVGLIVNRPELFPDNWIYVHAPHVRVGRIQNFKNWSAVMVPDLDTTSIGMEYFCDEGDDLWRAADGDLIRLATSEVAQLGLAAANDIVEGVVIRQPKAYPVYDRTYRENLAVIRAYLAGFENLQTIGRNGMHRYNNQDHSMLTGMLAVRNLLDDERHDLWSVNTERSYYEEMAPRRDPQGQL